MEEKLCTPDWLHEQLERPLPAVLILDCRSHMDFSQKGHIASAINVTLPALMLKRLEKGSLSVPNVINCQEARDVFLDRWKSDWICLYDDASSCTSGNSISKTLGEKLAAEGCRVSFLSGGYQSFCQLFPDYCIRATDSSPDSDKAVLGLRNLRISNRQESEPDDCDSGFSKESDTSRDAWHTVELFKILDHLYLGNAETAQDLKLLQNYNIRYILNVTPNLPNVYEKEIDLGIKYMQIPIQDCVGENLAAYFDDAIRFIEEACRNNRACLVHCRAGISRSVTVTVAYLMQKFSVNLNTAYEYVKSKKANVSPNFNFMGQLVEFERRLNITQSRIVPQHSADEGVPWSPDESPFAPGSILTDTGTGVRP